MRRASKETKWEVKHLIPGGLVRAARVPPLVAAPELLGVGGFCQEPVCCL